MEITKDFINHSKVINEGTTCYIMMNQSIIYKLYKGAMGYIFDESKYKLEEETNIRLNYIISKSNSVSLTDLPSDLLTFNRKPVGIPLTYYTNSIDLQSFLEEHLSEVDVNMIKQQVLNIVDELIKNGIIPTDPHLGNFMVCFNKNGTYNLKMIDIDDQYVSVYPDDKRDIWYDSQVAACYRVIDMSFDELYKSEKIQNIF